MKERFVDSDWVGQSERPRRHGQFVLNRRNTKGLAAEFATATPPRIPYTSVDSDVKSPYDMIISATKYGSPHRMNAATIITVIFRVLIFAFCSDEFPVLVRWILPGLKF